LNIQNACVECIINQSERVGKTLHLDDKTLQKLVSTTTKMSQSFSFSKTPPEVAVDVYEKLARIVGKEDLYDSVKIDSIQKASEFLPLLQKRLYDASDVFMTSLKIAVAGNVIDLAAEVAFDLKEELSKVFHTDFAHDDSLLLQKRMHRAKRIVVLGDNAGEHLFDKLAISVWKEMFQQAEFFYFVRGKPIINDVTLKEAKAVAFEQVCPVVDSGVDTPGFVYERSNEQARKLFDSADLVISKGMGNYECLTPSHKSPIAFLLKIKCGVVAASLGKEIGDIICKII